MKIYKYLVENSNKYDKVEVSNKIAGEEGENDETEKVSGSRNGWSDDVESGSLCWYERQYGNKKRGEQAYNLGMG